jgi:protein TonB
MSGKLDLLNKEWCDMVFEDRNQEYGAFELRKQYSKNIILGVILTAVIFALSIAGPIVARLISDALPQEEILKQTEVTTLEEPPPLDKNEPPPPPVEPPPPLKSTVKFTPPEIVPDKEVPEEPPPTQEDLKTVDASTKTVEGSDDGVDQSLLEGNGNQVVEEAAPEIFVTVEQMPEFPGGVEELYKFLGNNIKYPQMEKEAGIQGTVYLRFYIDANGKPNDISVARGVKGGPNLEQEAVRVLKAMPSWKPGKQNGKAVNVWYSLPIKFTLR